MWKLLKLARAEAWSSLLLLPHLTNFIFILKKINLKHIYSIKNKAYTYFDKKKNQSKSFGIYQHPSIICRLKIKKISHQSSSAATLLQMKF